VSEEAPYRKRKDCWSRGVRGSKRMEQYVGVLEHVNLRKCMQGAPGRSPARVD
jgi:hypothetical protein